MRRKDHQLGAHWHCGPKDEVWNKPITCIIDECLAADKAHLSLPSGTLWAQPFARLKTLSIDVITFMYVAIIYIGIPVGIR